MNTYSFPLLLGLFGTFFMYLSMLATITVDLAAPGSGSRVVFAISLLYLGCLIGWHCYNWKQLPQLGLYILCGYFIFNLCVSQADLTNIWMQLVLITLLVVTNTGVVAVFGPYYEDKLTGKVCEQFVKPMIKVFVALKAIYLSNYLIIQVIYLRTGNIIFESFLKHGDKSLFWCSLFEITAWYALSLFPGACRSCNNDTHCGI